MARETQTETRTETRAFEVHSTKIRCDKCGRELDHDNEYDLFPNEVIILLNNDECVSQRFRRDLCTPCLEPAWLTICQAIDADPDDISGSGFHDE